MRPLATLARSFTQTRQAHRVLVTKDLPGTVWMNALRGSGCHVRVLDFPGVVPTDTLRTELRQFKPHGVIGQLTERWDKELLAELAAGGGRVYSNYAVGVDNIDVQAATDANILIGNTPGVLTYATAEMAVALTFATARRLAEADSFTRRGKWKAWLPHLMLGTQLHRKRVGVVGCGRIGSAYARMMMASTLCDIDYVDTSTNSSLETYATKFSAFLESVGEGPVACRRTSLDEVVEHCDVISLHCALSDQTHHLITQEMLARMRPNAILINTARGPIVDEAALISHLERCPDFRAGLDVFENEPHPSPDFSSLPNVTLAPHIASSTLSTRAGMAAIAAANVRGVLSGFPLCARVDSIPVQAICNATSETEMPQVVPSLLNAAALGYS
mmetsp:Transcript_26965/g.64023  ORF Transcript_26965/g.64023 Transcript_26965/m.64023 type:complete len:388 (-) Transcript_26965:36-1199(-)